MFKLVRRGLRANLGRLVLTLISVMLGVALVSGAFVLADSLRAVFNQVSEDALAGIDAQVRAIPSDFGGPFAIPENFDESLVDTVRALPEVEYAEGQLQAFEQIYTVNEDGEANRPQGPPVLGFSWEGPNPASSLRLSDGAAPVGNQVAVDATQARRASLEIGDPVLVSGPLMEPTEFTLSGIIDFGEGGTGGAYFVVLDPPTMQRITGAEGEITFLNINATDGTSSDDLLAALETVIPDGLEAALNDELVEESQEAFGSFIDIFGNVLLGFALVVLFVSIFIIYNTFAILVGQRTRYLGLLRSIGASGPQIRFMVLIEALIIGIMASVIGLFGGLGVAAFLKWLFSTGGNQFPDGPLEIQPRTIIVVFTVGIGVTVLSALLPAFRASRVSPLEAVRDGGRKPRSLRFRITAGSAVLVPGIVSLIAGTRPDVEGFGDLGETTTRLALIGVGAALTFIGVSMLSALFAGRVAALLGRPVEPIKGVIGRLARDNASRNPQRTAATATALMIGLALITLVAVVSSSISSNFDRLLKESVTSDLFVNEPNQRLPFSAVLIEPLSQVDGVAAVSGYAEVRTRIEGEANTVVAFDSTTGTTVIDMSLVDGDVNLGDDGIAVFKSTAEDFGLDVGDTVDVEFESGFIAELTVRGIYDNNAAIGASWLIDRALTVHASSTDVGQIGIAYEQGVDQDAVRAEVEDVVAALPQLIVQDNVELREEVRGQITQLQIIVSGILGLSLIVAFFGIVNTMALSILERIREIGLLRAVGTTRRQLRSTVRWEAIIVSVFGSLLGVVMGMVLGWAAVIAIPDSFLNTLTVPWGQIVLFVLVGAVLGVVAAFFPAARAARLNVLDAIAHE
jgi:putative ABC transport system permease protein